MLNICGGGTKSWNYKIGMTAKKYKAARILDIIMLVPCNNTPGYKGHVIYLKTFDYGERVTIIDFLKYMKAYLSKIVESYKNTTISFLGNSGTTDLLLHIVQFWCACEFDEDI